MQPYETNTLYNLQNQYLQSVDPELMLNKKLSLLLKIKIKNSL